AGENIALASSEHNIVIRVNNLFGPSPSVEEGSLKKPMGNFALLMLHLARERTKVEVVYDQVSTPTYTPDLAEAVWQLAQQTHGGLFHLSNAGEVSYADYAQEVFRLAGVACEVKPVSSKMYAAAARRPLYSTLSNKKAHDAGVTPLRYWHEALEVFIQSLRTTGGLGRRNGN
ncbi:MAG: rfbD, partial [Chthonomonadales bacterium]|nr:rfbD [Chthonomonadales bacterium]